MPKSVQFCPPLRRDILVSKSKTIRKKYFLNDMMGLLQAIKRLREFQMKKMSPLSFQKEEGPTKTTRVIVSLKTTMRKLNSLWGFFGSQFMCVFLLNEYCPGFYLGPDTIGCIFFYVHSSITVFHCA